jgi:hypothetical protein
MNAGVDRNMAGHGGTEDWIDANKLYLLAALEVVKVRLRRHLRHKAVTTGTEFEPDPNEETAPAAVAAARRTLSAPAALERLCRIFSLSAFERDVVLLCVGFELGTFDDLHLLPDGSRLPREAPTFGLAMAALADPHWSALSPASPLRQWSLIEVMRRDTLVNSPLAVDERILNYLVGLSHLDERIQDTVAPYTAAVDVSPSQARTAEQIVGCLRRSQVDNDAWPVIRLCGRDQAGKLAVAAAACRSLGFQLYQLNAADLPRMASDRSAWARLWDRDAVLSGAALLVIADDVEDTQDSRRGTASFVDRLQGITFIDGARTPPLADRQTVRVDVDKPSRKEQRAIWSFSLGEAGRRLNGQIDALVNHFDLGAHEIRAASLAALSEYDGKGSDRTAVADGMDQALWAACRVQGRPHLDEVAQRIEPMATWDDLVLPEPQRQVLRDVARQVRGRTKVHEDWGFARKCSRGLGIGALFTGDSGTGKTMAAEVVANDLKLDLYRIDLSQVVSKYIGETEKNLKQVFDAAEGGGAILLFDEADAIFGKRSDVKDSHDRFANIEISYLLQRIEVYRGLAVLTTNMKNAIDNAFLRRLRFIVRFPFPDAEQRAEIWRRTFPPATPTQDLDLKRLGRMNLAGGNIRNIALNAAFLAADENRPVTMEHVLQAARSEYAKLEKPITGAELGLAT